MSVEIKKVETKRDLGRFIKLPFSIYRGNSCWVPPLISDEYNTLRKDINPAFEFSEAEYWIAYKDGKPAGRIAGIICNPANEKWGTKNGRFGWVDFIDDREVVEALFETVENWCREKGMEKLAGPMGFSDYDSEGMLIEGFDELGTLPMIYNHAYYPKYLESIGFVKDVDWIEFEVRVPEEIPEKILRVNELVLKRTGLKLAVVKNRKELVAKYGKQLFKVLEEGYADLYGTVPISERQVDTLIKQYLGFIDIRYTKVVVDKEDNVAAIGIAMPSLSRGLQRAKGRIFPFGWLPLLYALKKPKILDLYLVAVKPEYSGRGLPALMMVEINRNAIEAGIEYAETSGELETNTKVQQLWSQYDSRQHKRRRVFIKELNQIS